MAEREQASGHAFESNASGDGDRGLTWASLLAHWTAVAQASAALPANADGDRWRASIAPAIGLQAVAKALEDLDALSDPSDRPVAQDRAEIVIRQHASELHAAWAGEELPVILEQFVLDARRALDLSRSRGVLWRVASAEGLAAAGADRAIVGHPGEVAQVLAAAGFGGDVLLPSPGVPLFADSPAAFVRGPAGLVPGGAVVSLLAEHLAMETDGLIGGPVAAARPLQVYRQYDFAQGRAVRDVVAPLDGEPQAGQPLLVYAVRDGEPQRVALPPRAGPPLPVLRVTETGDTEPG